ncbi:MAG: isoprenyl transferase [Anaerovoracaceae bacterium]|jgi:undecaprenyl diphosphate synthase
MKNELLRDNIPRHIAIVMDGNGRWAVERNLPRLAGHNAGMKALKEIVKECSALGVKHLTVYAFSTENWKRPEDEVKGIFKILIIYVNKELAELHRNNVRVNILGDYTQLPSDAVAKLEESLKCTEKNEGMQFNIALNYGGRREILDGVRLLAKKVAKGEISPDEITEQTFSDVLYTSKIPDPELIIRTGGELRLSNYLLWQSSYSEFVFTDTLWPDFTPDKLDDAILEYQRRIRRFGGVR